MPIPPKIQKTSRDSGRKPFSAQIVLLTCTILLSWLCMQVVHEAGHCLGAAWTGGRIVHVDLHPMRISQTFVDPNPHPVIVIWSGPVGGCLIPLIIWGITRFLLEVISKLKGSYFKTLETLTILNQKSCSKGFEITSTNNRVPDPVLCRLLPDCQRCVSGNGIF